MTELIQRLLEPESTVRTALGLAITAVVFFAGVLLVDAGVVSRPALTRQVLITFVSGVVSGMALTVLSHYLLTVSRRRSVPLVRMSTVAVATTLMFVLLRQGTIVPTTLFLWGMGLLSGTAVVQIVLYLRLRPTA